MEPLAASRVGTDHLVLHRRRLFGWAAGGLAIPWLTPVAHALAAAEEKNPDQAFSIIFVHLFGGPSQLETFDPHPGTDIAAGSKARDTALPGVQLGEGFEQLADLMDSVALIRSLVSKEGDHERATYLLKTGYRPDPTAHYPTLGAICCHQLPETGRRGEVTEIPRHVSILPGAWPAWGGFLGSQYNAFQTYDPARAVPDVKARVSDERFSARQSDIQIAERAFGRRRQMQTAATGHVDTRSRAIRMMSSEQLAAFDVSHEPQAVRDAYGDTPFGRGCLAARRLTEVGVRCVEVTLSNWDAHAANHELHRNLLTTLDPALSALLRDLKDRDLWRNTLVVCGGEFGRTPKMNALEGRDHWPHGFSLLLAGGPIRPGVVLGETDPDGGRDVNNPYQVADIHTTLLHALGIDPTIENISRTQRPIKLADGKPIVELLDPDFAQRNGLRNA